MGRKKKRFEQYFNKQWKMKCDSKHHIIPQSRGGNGSHENIAVINEELHERFHRLFANRTPEECIEFMVEYFFGGDYELLEYVLNKKEMQHWRKVWNRS